MQACKHKGARADDNTRSETVTSWYKAIYYNMQQCREMEAIVKDAGYVILWIIDQEHSKQDEHFISYKDIRSGTTLPTD